MRIAVTGTHGSGKTSLIDDFVDMRPDYAREQEPYWQLAQNGVPFADGVSLPDLEEQLEASCRLILARAGDADVIFDRCPLDFVAYLEIVSASEGATWEPSGRQLGRIEKALAALDLLVFLPLSQPDEIATRIEFPRLRGEVDARLKLNLGPDMLAEMDIGALRVVRLRGSRAGRLGALLKLVS